MVTVAVVPWAGDLPRLHVLASNISLSISAPKRTFWVYFGVQTIPSKKFDGLDKVASAAKWSFVIDTGIEQLSCSNTSPHDVRETLDHAILSFSTATAKWKITMSTEDARHLSDQIRKSFSQFDAVDHKPNKTFTCHNSVLKNSGEMLKYRFTSRKK